MKFSDLNLVAELNQAIEKLNYKDCTPIQEQAIPHILEGKDVAGLAQTGTGKTAAFLVPLIERVLRSTKQSNQQPSSETSQPDFDTRRIFVDWKPFHYILALVPTRELAEQVYENFNSLVGDCGLKACSIYGGTSYEKQKEGLKSGVTLVVATPGRLIDLYKEHLIDLKQVRAVVFDEADRMFDMGFKDDMKYLLQRIPNDRQFLVFSATLNFDVLNTAYQFGANPVEVNISRDQAKAENVEDSIFHLGTDDKPKYLLSLMKLHQPKQCVIFSNFKNQIEPLVKFLRANGIPALGISSLLTQAQRNKVLQQFKEENETQVLVATDVAARGLDIQGIDMVFNYELPQDCETYVHRIGRTGRAGLMGKAFSFVGDRDVDSLVRIEEYLKHKINVGWLEDKDILTEFVDIKEVSRKEDGFREGRRYPNERRKRERPFRDKEHHKGGGRKNISDGEEEASGQVEGRTGAHGGEVAGRAGGGRYAKGGRGDAHHKREYHHRGDSKRGEHPLSHRRDHAAKNENASRREKSEFQHKKDGAAHSQKRQGKTQSYHHQGHHKSKSHVPTRAGVYKINFWYRVVRFFKNMFQ